MRPRNKMHVMPHELNEPTRPSCRRRPTPPDVEKKKGKNEGQFGPDAAPSTPPDVEKKGKEDEGKSSLVRLPMPPALLLTWKKR